MDISEQLQSLPPGSHLASFMNRCFGVGNWIFCEEKNLYIGRSPDYKGPGIGFYAVRPNGRWFTGIRKDVDNLHEWNLKPWEGPPAINIANLADYSS